MKIRTKLLTSTSIVIIATMLITIITVALSLNIGVTSQVDSLKAGLMEQAGEKGLADAKVLEILISSLEEELTTQVRDICGKSVLKRNFGSGQDGALRQYLVDNYSEAGYMDFGIFFGSKGNFAASHPDNVNFNYMNKSFKTFPFYNVFQEYVKNENH